MIVLWYRLADSTGLAQVRRICVKVAVDQYHGAIDSRAPRPRSGALVRRSNFSARTNCEVLKITMARNGKRATGVTYIDSSGEVWEQPAELHRLRLRCPPSAGSYPTITSPSCLPTSPTRGATQRVPSKRARSERRESALRVRAFYNSIRRLPARLSRQ